ncbi:MAG TPA: DUF4034 domain-containing protein [Myxococcota bacterium]|nr:DUF4034 domain-containing protein [Myxococcota bacterium]
MGRLACAIVLAVAMARAAATAPVLDSADFALDSFRRGRFGELDATLDRLANDDVRMNTGERATDVLIARLGQMLSADETLLPQLERWRLASKRRPWAELSQATREQSLAWRARGGGYAGSVPADAWLAFYAHLESAEAALARALKIAPGAREPLAARVLLALYRGLPAEEIAARFNEAVRVDPVSPKAHDAMFLALTPRWHGAHDMLLAFAREVAHREPDDPYLALLVVRAHQEVVSSDWSAEQKYYRAPNVWAEVSGALEKFLASYPDSSYGHNLLARLALLGGQREVLRRELAWIGEASDMGVWRDQGEFMRARTWAVFGPMKHPAASPPAAQTP